MVVRGSGGVYMVLERGEREREGTLWKSEECCSVSSSDSLECKPNLISYNTIDTSTYNLVNLVLN